MDIPATPVTNLTTFNNAIDFSGSNEYAVTANSGRINNPIRMADLAVVSAHNAVDGKTSDDANSRPWATAIVFKADGNNSNQHIWNQGEGSGSSDDNIYLRLSSSRDLFFGWGRDGSYNECQIGNIGGNIGGWWSVYIASTGARFGSAGATAENLAKSFDIRLTSNATNWAAGSNLSTESNWIVTGGNMNKTVAGYMSIGGRRSNRSFHGKVASMVITTLRADVDMPDSTEIEMMITDPNKWVQDYKIGNSYRHANSNTEDIFELPQLVVTLPKYI